MFHNRAYRLISRRIGLDDYRGFVDAKLKTAAELYGFLVDRINHQRALVLELMVVIILIIELFNLQPRF